MDHPPSDDSRIHVLIADDDPAFVQALRELIDRQPELAVIGAAGDGLEAIVPPTSSARTRSSSTCTCRFSTASAPATRLRRDHPSLCLIALTGDEAPELHRAVRDAGADEVLLKSARRGPARAPEESAGRRLMARAGIEPATPRFSAVCSTN
jgi:DNA-binding NarL/FixJ family response regulator